MHVRLSVRRLRKPLAIAALALACVAVWLLPQRAAQAPATRVDLLRAAFDEASAECYERFRGAELQSCLTGVMEAHLQALDGAEPPHDDAGEVARVRLPST